MSWWVRLLFECKISRPQKHSISLLKMGDSTNWPSEHIQFKSQSKRYLSMLQFVWILTVHNAHAATHETIAALPYSWIRFYTGNWFKLPQFWPTIEKITTHNIHWSADGPPERWRGGTMNKFRQKWKGNCENTGGLLFVHHLGWYVGVKMRAWNLASAYMMTNCPISKFAKNKDLARTRLPVRHQAWRPIWEIGGVLWGTVAKKANLITPNETKFIIKNNICQRWSHV